MLQTLLQKPHPKEPFCDETVLNTLDDAYSSTDCRDAWVRVLCWNPVRASDPTEQRKRRAVSLLGPGGHIERASAYTHLFAAIAFALFALVRPLILESKSLQGQLAMSVYWVAAGTFVTSVVYHVGNSIPGYAFWLRALDHFSIDVLLCCAGIADLAVASKGLVGAPWQTVGDPILAALVGVVFFLYRRVVLPASQTRVLWGDCRLGLFRVQHSDGAHGSLRSSLYLTLTFSFLLALPAAFRTISLDGAKMLLVCNTISLLLLIVGIYTDNAVLAPDWQLQEAYLQGPARSAPLSVFNMKRCGCLCTSHSFWHILSILSAVIVSFGREYALKTSA